jgi:hypothetical protein
VFFFSFFCPFFSPSLLSQSPGTISRVSNSLAIVAASDFRSRRLFHRRHKITIMKIIKLIPMMDESTATITVMTSAISKVLKDRLMLHN